jgi:tyrosyl-tRNA synthetase
MSTRLGASHDALMSLLRRDPDLRDPAAVLQLLARRRGMDLTDLPPAEQANLLAGRAHTLLPGEDALADLLGAGRPLTVKFGIDPTAADVHIGHAVPMIVASRFQRMGHRVVFIVGDVTGKIGDPSGRVADRPALTDDDIRANMATYRRQVRPFFDFDRAAFRYNSEWLGQLTLPRFLEVLARLPLSMCSATTSATGSPPVPVSPRRSSSIPSSWRSTRSRWTPTSRSAASISCSTCRCAGG